jgi:hypothetical protein
MRSVKGPCNRTDLSHLNIRQEDHIETLRITEHFVENPPNTTHDLLRPLAASA